MLQIIDEILLFVQAGRPRRGCHWRGLPCYLRTSYLVASSILFITRSNTHSLAMTSR
jgi:hypothetical protein